MVTSVRGARGSETRRIVKVIDSRRAVDRIERVLTPDRATISNEGRKRWSQQRRAAARQNRNTRRGRDFELNRRGLGKTFRVWPGRRKAQSEPHTVASVQQHVAEGGKVSGQIKFDYPIQVGGQPRLVEGVLRFEADVESGRPVVTIPLDENISFSGGLNTVYRVPDSTEVNLLSQVAANQDEETTELGTHKHLKVLKKNNTANASSTPHQKGASVVQGLRVSKFLRKFALQSYSTYAANDNSSRTTRRFVATI
ncbi:MAG: hypothetical protein VYC39_10375 [Myxococcota bacterium]|nr:hypothetical protein [Myxococcota bacterium]